jgi:hypothetical protein
VRKAELVELDGDHACILEDPELFLSALTAHIATR